MGAAGVLGAGATAAAVARRMASGDGAAPEGRPGAGERERSDRDVGGPTSPQRTEEGGQAAGGAPGTKPESGFEPHR